MMCLDTNFLIVLWRSGGKSDHPVRLELSKHPDELLVVCIPVAGEFLEGAAFISEERYRQAVPFLQLFDIRSFDMETAGRYAHLVAWLRRKRLLEGMSKADLWLAAYAQQHRAKVATQNVRHFKRIPELEIVSF